MKKEELKDNLHKGLYGLVDEWFDGSNLPDTLFNGMAKTVISSNINKFDGYMELITNENGDIMTRLKEDMEKIRGNRVLIVDDVISTGESLRALESLVTSAGGNIVGKMAVLAEGAAAQRDDIIFLEKLPLFFK